MASLRELTTKIGFEVDDKQLKKLNDSLATVKKSMLAVAAAGAAIGAGLFTLAKSTADAGDEIAKTSSRLGLSAKFLQEYRFAAEQAGVSNELLTQSLGAFNRRIGEFARSGAGPAANALTEMGISVKDTNGNLKSNEVLLGEVTAKLSTYKDASVKAALADSLFSESGRKMIDFLGAGNEEIQKFRDRANQLGIVLDDKTLKASEAFGDSLNELKQVFLGIKNVIGGALIPVITEATDGFIKFALANRELIVSRLKDFITGSISLLKSLASVVMTVVNVFQFFAQIVGGSESALKLIIGTIIAFKALAFGQAVFSIVTALFAMRGAILATSAAFLASPLGIIVLITALVKATIAFGKWLNQFEFFKSIFSSMGDWIMKTFATPIEYVSKLIDKLFNSFPKLGKAFKAVGSFFGITSDDHTAKDSTVVAADKTNNIASQASRASAVNNIASNKSVSVNSDINITVPRGTSDQQEAFLKDAAKKSFDEMYNGHLEKALFENSELE